MIDAIRAVLAIVLGQYSYVYDDSIEKYYQFKYGSYSCVGRIDKDGNIEPDWTTLRNPDTVATGGAVNHFVNKYNDNELLYEYRSGYLIPMRYHPMHGLQPVVGNIIISFNAYVYSPFARRIYNLPGRFVLMKINDINSSFKQLIQKPHPIASSSPETIAEQLHPDPHVFEFDLAIRYRHSIGDCSFLGTLDNKGQFVPDLTTANSTFGLIGGPSKLIEAKTPNEKVYEYRTGILVPMYINDKNKLIPEVGGKIIDFKDYQYSPTARRIYNLPGRFVLKKDEPEKKP